MNNHLMDEISLCFTSSEINLVRCGYSCLLRYLDGHGMSIDGWTMSEARSALAYHLLFGMCTAQRGTRCKQTASPLGKHATMATISNIVTTLCQNSQIRPCDLRFMSNAVGLVVPCASTFSDMSSRLQKTFVPDHESDRGFDLHSFFSVLDKTAKVDLYRWCSDHGLYPFGSAHVVKELLLKHVMSAACFEQAPPLRAAACRDVTDQHITTFPDANKRAFLLSVLCLNPHCSLDTITTIFRMTTGQQLSGHSRASVVEKLRLHIFTLRRGRAVYHSVLRASYAKKEFTLMSRIRNAWPQIAEPVVMAENRSLFEKTIITKSTCRDVCAACSVKYTADGFTDVSSSELDLSPLGVPDDWPSSYSSFNNWGPLSNLAIDARGVLSHMEQEARLRLCRTCALQIDASRAPKFAVANYLYFGDIPDVLRDLSVVEENMIALCRARCILVQLRTMRGGANSQRAYRGHAIFHQQDTTKVFSLVPPDIEDILSPICVLFIGSTRPSVKWIRENAKPLVVRANRV